MAGIITDAGKAQAADKPVGPSRKELVLELARRLRAAKTDEDYADSLSAALELAKLDD